MRTPIRALLTACAMTAQPDCRQQQRGCGEDTCGCRVLFLFGVLDVHAARSKREFTVNIANSSDEHQDPFSARLPEWLAPNC